MEPKELNIPSDYSNYLDEEAKTRKVEMVDG